MRITYKHVIGKTAEGKDVALIDLSCDSSETKLTDATAGDFVIAGSSRCIENDTGTISTWSEGEGAWVEQFSLQG